MSLSQELKLLPEKLIQLRKDKGWTQKRLADELGIGEQQIQMYEHTKYQKVSFWKIVKIAEVLENEKAKKYDITWKVVNGHFVCDNDDFQNYYNTLLENVENGVANRKNNGVIIFYLEKEKIDFFNCENNKLILGALVTEATRSISGRKPIYICFRCCQIESINFTP